MAKVGKRLFLLLALALGSCAGQAPTFDEVAATVPPVPAGAARIVLYRDFEPYQSLSWVPVFLNGKTIGAVGPGHVIMRDEPPGTYRLEAKSEGLWPDQVKTVTAAAGETIYAKITSFKGLDPGADGGGTMTTFVLILVDPAAGRREIGKLWYTARLQRPAIAG
ncbi:MAG: hypothetical protein ACLQJR_15655 [Stellaceae bacterium]